MSNYFAISYEVAAEEAVKAEAVAAFNETGVDSTVSIAGDYYKASDIAKTEAEVAAFVSSVKGG